MICLHFLGCNTVQLVVGHDDATILVISCTRKDTLRHDVYFKIVNENSSAHTCDNNNQMKAAE